MSKRVLYVDDESMMLRVIGHTLGVCGWQVVTAQTPEQASWDVDVVIADWRPYGPEVVRQARERGVPVVVYTGAPDSVPSGLRVVDKLAVVDVLEEALKEAIRE